MIIAKYYMYMVFLLATFGDAMAATNDIPFPSFGSRPDIRVVETPRDNGSTANRYGDFAGTSVKIIPIDIVVHHEGEVDTKIVYTKSHFILGSMTSPTVPSVLIITMGLNEDVFTAGMLQQVPASLVDMICSMYMNSQIHLLNNQIFVAVTTTQKYAKKISFDGPKENFNISTLDIPIFVFIDKEYLPDARKILGEDIWKMTFDDYIKQIGKSSADKPVERTVAIKTEREIPTDAGVQAAKKNEPPNAGKPPKNNTAKDNAKKGNANGGTKASTEKPGMTTGSPRDLSVGAAKPVADGNQAVVDVKDSVLGKQDIPAPTVASVPKEKLPMPVKLELTPDQSAFTGLFNEEKDELFKKVKFRLPDHIQQLKSNQFKRAGNREKIDYCSKFQISGDLATMILGAPKYVRDTLRLPFKYVTAPLDLKFMKVEDGDLMKFDSFDQLSVSMYHDAVRMDSAKGMPKNVSFPVSHTYRMVLSHPLFAVTGYPRYYTAQPEGYPIPLNFEKLPITVAMAPKTVDVILRVKSSGDFAGAPLPKSFQAVSTRKVSVEMAPGKVTKLALADGFDKPFNIDIPEDYADEVVIEGKRDVEALTWNKVAQPKDIAIIVSRKLYKTKLTIELKAEGGVEKMPVDVALEWNSGHNSFSWKIPSDSKRDTLIDWPKIPDSIWISARKPDKLNFSIDDKWDSETMRRAILWEPGTPIQMSLVKLYPLQLIYVDMTFEAMGREALVTSMRNQLASLSEATNNVNKALLFISNGMDRYYNYIDGDNYTKLLTQYAMLPPRIFDELKYLAAKVAGDKRVARRVDISYVIYLSGSSLETMLRMSKEEFNLAVKDARLPVDARFYVDAGTLEKVRDHPGIKNGQLFGSFDIIPLQHQD